MNFLNWFSMIASSIILVILEIKYGFAECIQNEELLLVITVVFAYYQLRDGFRDLNKVKNKR